MLPLELGSPGVVVGARSLAGEGDPLDVVAELNDDLHPVELALGGLHRFQVRRQPEQRPAQQEGDAADHQCQPEDQLVPQPPGTGHGNPPCPLGRGVTAGRPAAWDSSPPSVKARRSREAGGTVPEPFFQREGNFYRSGGSFYQAPTALFLGDRFVS